MGNSLTHSKNFTKLKNHFGNIRSQFDANDYIGSIIENKTKIIEKVKEKYQTEFLIPIQTEFDEAVSNINNKEKVLSEARQRKESLKESKQTISQQLDEIGSVLNTL